MHLQNTRYIWRDTNRHSAPCPAPKATKARGGLKFKEKTIKGLNFTKSLRGMPGSLLMPFRSLTEDRRDVPRRRPPFSIPARTSSSHPILLGKEPRDPSPAPCICTGRPGQLGLGRPGIATLEWGRGRTVAVCADCVCPLERALFVKDVTQNPHPPFSSHAFSAQALQKAPTNPSGEAM